MSATIYIIMVAGRIQQVDGESDSQGFLLVPFFFYFLLKEAWGGMFIVAKGNPRPQPLNDSYE